MSGRRVTDWTRLLQVAVSRRRLLHGRKVVQVMPMATFSTYAEVLSPDHPVMKNYKAAPHR